VRRALERRRPVVANDVAHDTFLATHGALPSNHPQALLCVPLCAGDRTLGAIYADRTIAGPAITMHDLELLQAFAEHAALWIAARHATEAALREADIAPRWSRIVASQGEDA
jgi:GAF domain-containing protein